MTNLDFDKMGCSRNNQAKRGLIRLRLPIAGLFLMVVAISSSCASSGGRPQSSAVPSPNGQEIRSISPSDAIDIDRIRAVCTVASGAPCPSDRFNYAHRVEDNKIVVNASFVIMRYVSESPLEVKLTSDYPYYFCGFTKSRDGQQDLLTQVRPENAPFDIPGVTYGVFSREYYSCDTNPTEFPIVSE